MLNFLLKYWKLLIIATVAIVLLFIPLTSLGRKGCCSWHGGVLGCDNNTGRLICRDGTYSPSCTCIIKSQRLVKASVTARKNKPILFISPERAQVHCSNDEVVWLNTSTGVWHTKWQRWYGSSYTALFRPPRASKSF
jgi:hypothetical protein